MTSKQAPASAESLSIHDQPSDNSPLDTYLKQQENAAIEYAKQVPAGARPLDVEISDYNATWAKVRANYSETLSALEIADLRLHRLFDIDAALNHATGQLSDNAARYEFWLGLKATFKREVLAWKQAKLPAFDDQLAGFGKQCDIEIAKSRKLMKAKGVRMFRQGVSTSTTPAYYTMDQWAEVDLARLKKKAELETEAEFKKKSGETAKHKEPDVAKNKIKRHPDLTIDRAILLIDAIGGSRLKSADREKLAEVIAFLIGNETESVRQRYSALNPNNGKYKGNSESGIKTLQDDLKKLSYYFDLIGLRGELTKLSDNLGIPLTK